MITSQEHQNKNLRCTLSKYFKKRWEKFKKTKKRFIF